MVAKKGIMSGLEDNLNSLENLVLKLESGQLSIDEAIEAYSSGMKLAAKCKKSLDEMTQKVTAARAEASKILGETSGDTPLSQDKEASDVNAQSLSEGNAEANRSQSDDILF